MLSTLLLIGLLGPLSTVARPPGDPRPAGRIGPPSPALRDAFGLHPVYQKCLVADGLPIVASAQVSDFALLEARYLIDHMLEGRDDLRAELVRNRVRFAVLGCHERTTDLPEHSDLRPAVYWNRRARGLGASRSRPAVSCGEENLLGFAGDPYRVENILIHEFAHAIQQMAIESLLPDLNRRILEAYRGAMDSGLWQGKYAATNASEYWAEGAQSWFDTNREDDHDHNHVNTREELREYDAALAVLCEEVFGDREWRYVHPADRSGPEHLAGYDAGTAPTFAWSPAGLQAYREHNQREDELARREDEPRVDWLRRRADAGQPAGERELGRRFLEGRDLQQDDAAAAAWFSRAAEQGDPQAQFDLAELYASGRGVARDPAAAQALVLNAAERGYPRAMLRAAELLGAHAPESAYVWATRAADRGSRGAEGRASALEADLAPGRIQLLRARARDWMPRVQR